MLRRTDSQREGCKEGREGGRYESLIDAIEADERGGRKPHDAAKMLILANAK